MVGRSGFRAALILLLLLAAVPLLSGAGSGAAGPGSPVRAAGDLDADGRPEQYLLADGVLTVREGSRDLWESPPDWRVDSFALGDADNDGEGNLVISLWKEGSFGEIRPFWHTGADNGRKNHLFVYKLQEDTCKPVWCSSDLTRPIIAFFIRDADGDGRNELIVEEGQYRETSGGQYAPDPDGSVRTAVWQWEEWGFRLCDPS
jgi:poly-gamma-glutamate synthesis protein (capsule biosynthesis protein)